MFCWYNGRWANRYLFVGVPLYYWCHRATAVFSSWAMCAICWDIVNQLFVQDFVHQPYFSSVHIVIKGMCLYSILNQQHAYIADQWYAYKYHWLTIGTYHGQYMHIIDQWQVNSQSTKQCKEGKQASEASSAIRLSGIGSANRSRQVGQSGWAVWAVQGGWADLLKHSLTPHKWPLKH